MSLILIIENTLKAHPKWLVQAEDGDAAVKSKVNWILNEIYKQSNIKVSEQLVQTILLKKSDMGVGNYEPIEDMDEGEGATLEEAKIIFGVTDPPKRKGMYDKRN